MIRHLQLQQLLNLICVTGSRINVNIEEIERERERDLAITVPGNAGLPS